MTDKLQNTHAFQHNEFIRNPLRMGELEAKLFIHALAHINQRANKLPPISIPMTRIIGDNPCGRDYENVWKACKALAAQHINVLPPVAKPRQKRTLVNIISTLSLDPGTGLLTGDFNQKAAPYLLKLKDVGNFTFAEIEKLLTFKNANSARLYWILLSYRHLGGKTRSTKKQIELSELKEWILTDKDLYPVFTDFKKRVLDPIADDFKLINFGATWVPVKTGKKTTALLFTIPLDKKPPKQLAAAPATVDTSFTSWLASTKDTKLQAAYTGLTSEVNQLSTRTAQAIITHVHQHPEIAPKLYACRHRIATHTDPIKNRKSFVLKALNDSLGTEFK